jgi:hypothetical protein
MFNESPPVERSGMLAGCVFVFPGSRDQQTVESSVGVSFQFGFSSGVGQFRKRRCEPLRRAAECVKAGPSPRLLAGVPAPSGPGEASRANSCPAGRSLAALLLTRRYAKHRGLLLSRSSLAGRLRYLPASAGASWRVPFSVADISSPPDSALNHGKPERWIAR